MGQGFKVANAVFSGGAEASEGLIFGSKWTMMNAVLPDRKQPKHL